MNPWMRFLPAGSSPRGRGKPDWRRRRSLGAGLIPAWAGKTRGPWRPGRRIRAHPRVGGENNSTVSSGQTRSGSSPRGRGKRSDPPLGTWPSAAHPRVGGENGSGRSPPPTSWGSSPRGRGKRLFAEVEQVPRGLIPAWAGKTAQRSPRSRPAPAHPRVGGENRRRSS